MRFVDRAVGFGGSVLHYDGKTWNTMNGEISVPLFDVCCSQNSGTFVIGQGGTVVRHDGKTWNVMNRGTSANLRGIWRSSQKTSLLQESVVRVSMWFAGCPTACCGNVEYKLLIR